MCQFGKGMAMMSRLPFWRFVVRQVRPWSLVEYILNLTARRECRAANVVSKFISGKTGLEVGGPSQIFSDGGIIPIYSRVAAIDNCQFSNKTMWQGEVIEGRVQWASAGTQFISEANDLASVPDAKYDFLVASHVLEHLANPIKALKEWTRTVKDGGVLLVIVPHRSGTFDHNRSYAQFDHLLDDLKNNTPEDDLTHVEEILSRHDFALDPGAGSRAEFEDSARNNEKFRRLHHHVFSPELLVEISNYLGLLVTLVEIELPYHIILVIQKRGATAAHEIERHNAMYLAKEASWRVESPFKDDRIAVISKLSSVR